MLNLEKQEGGKLPKIMGATIDLDGNNIDLDLEMKWCADPVCPCDEIMLEFYELQNDRRIGVAFTLAFEAKKRRYKITSTYADGDLRAGKLRTAIMRQTTEEDYNRIKSEWYAQKQHATMSSMPEEIKANFNHKSIESEGTTVSLYKIFPHYEKLSININGEAYIVDPSFCVRSGCKCTQCFVVIQAVSGETTKYKAEYSIDFAAHTWEVVDIDKSSPEWVSDVNATKKAFELTPSLYGWLRKSSVFLKRCYAEHLKRLSLSGNSEHNETLVAVVGRNDPCPCGSGKKYKKCCMT